MDIGLAISHTRERKGIRSACRIRYTQAQTHGMYIGAPGVACSARPPVRGTSPKPQIAPEITRTFPQETIRRFGLLERRLLPRPAASIISRERRALFGTPAVSYCSFYPRRDASEAGCGRGGGGIERGPTNTHESAYGNVIRRNLEISENSTHPLVCRLTTEPLAFLQPASTHS